MRTICARKAYYVDIPNFLYMYELFQKIKFI
jgi:hypothetical protein